MNDDTVNLLKECNAGCKSATNSMEQVLPYTNDEELKSLIKKFNQEHIEIGEECHTLLQASNKKEEDPSGIAKIVSWVSTEVKLMINDESEKIAQLMVDGCNMGIKSLSEYTNQYTNASDESKQLVKKLIVLEERFMNELLPYL